MYLKIAFWSNTPGQAGTTSNLVGVALMASMSYHYKTMILQSQYGLYNLDSALMDRGRDDLIREEFSYYYENGIDYLLRKSIISGITTDDVKQGCVEIVRDRAYYIPATIKNSREIYQENIKKHLQSILEAADEFADLTFIDAGCGVNEISARIFEAADMIVVNFNQNCRAMNQFFQSYQKFSEKLVFLIGSYDYNSTYNAKNVQRMYRIDRKNLGVIPYNVGFQDAFGEGKVVRFLKSNFNCREHDKNYYFIKELKASSNMILKRAGLVD
ncbi:hypothetical protein SAMN05421730_100395 [Anaerobium acetethylicum]|uniref:Cellulose biosynthesis protein BcsQ n=1 Tax=Anaerobium acetethylicum TaxID=1619234 RepID=A0A1D3TQQ9_9FIRM|nr:hypothetical protein SAMN05421730_100395 [Anaerobium acetethylicum]